MHRPAKGGGKDGQNSLAGLRPLEKMTNTSVLGRIKAFTGKAWKRQCACKTL